MKPTLLIALTLFILTACNKTTSESGELNGTWTLTKINGNFILDTIPERFKETLSLNEGTYEMTIGDSTITGTYTTAQDTGVIQAVCLQIEPGIYSRRIDFSKNNADQKVYYQVEGNTLKLISGCFAYDAGAEKIYSREPASTK